MLWSVGTLEGTEFQLETLGKHSSDSELFALLYVNALVGFYCFGVIRVFSCPLFGDFFPEVFMMVWVVCSSDLFITKATPADAPGLSGSCIVDHFLMVLSNPVPLVLSGELWTKE
ncbi:hypothetical protein BV22DRAFT_1052380 [Leucogyrophana mollusca]|uniref:Uncharacterized protein n=1 Tax=Leucogyrophana mollusca TaxID=85980 RepID=A0ACB8AVU4_9AGAM|nr:hypothetical protein BV22DRAFT_1052380 [Leucogyrophana mollusca]